MARADGLLLLGVCGVALLAGSSGASASQRPAERKVSGNASQLAHNLLASLQTKADKYDRKVCADFQSAAGLSVDGLYGPETKAALGRYVPNPPAIVFKGANATPKGGAAPNMTLSQRSQGEAAASAAKVASAAVRQPAMPRIQAKGNAIASQLRELAPENKRPVNASGVDFALAKKTAPDVAAHIRKSGRAYKVEVVKQFQRRAAIKDDGLYGPTTASALRFYGANAPAPLFKGANAQYVPPKMELG